MLSFHFYPFRQEIVGIQSNIETPYGKKPLVYADWTASGRLYLPIEKKLCFQFGELIGNTHSESTTTGTVMTYAYHEALQIIKRHVNAAATDVIITAGSGMTEAVNKLQRILGLRVHEKYQNTIPQTERPIVFVTHKEHHSNQTSWLETIAEVYVLPPDEKGLVNPQALKEALEKYKDRPLKIGAFTSCSNVTGIFTPYHQLARIMHEHGGYCFVDFAASAPYIAIDMHPADEMEKLDAIYFSPHKFLGGPASSGVLIFDSQLYKNAVPDRVGGGVVNWTNPWGGHDYVRDIEAREDAGTPGFMQAIRTALAIKLKEDMGVEKIHQREHEIMEKFLPVLRSFRGVHILGDNGADRLAIVSFLVVNIHYNLIVKVLNDYFGIQARGGCSCAGTYGHYLLNVTQDDSERVTCKISQGDNTEKPGWVRISFHPTTTDEEIDYILYAISFLIEHISAFKKEYTYHSESNEFVHQREQKAVTKATVKHWFEFEKAMAGV
ncbi:MAG: aminotransferase class V-fold PLP-dependent enzyme [Bacteroidia bacterium]